MKQQQETELSFKAKLVEGLTAHWKVATIVLAAVVVLMAGILILDFARRGKANDSAELSEDIQDAYQEWMREAPEARDSETLDGLIDEAVADYPKMFAAQRAIFTRGLMALETEDWETAVNNFETVADTWKDSYLAPVSLFNAGSAKEESGDASGAVESWQRLVDTYATVSPDAPEALFNIGRVSEGQGDTEAALEAYQAIAADFPDSRWTDLGKSRILVLESR